MHRSYGTPRGHRRRAPSGLSDGRGAGAGVRRLQRWRTVRVAVTMEQSWHRVPGGTATAALAVASALAARADAPEQVGVTAWHRSPAPAPFEPSMPVRRLPLPRLALYEAWSRAPVPRVEWATGGVDVVHATTIVPAASRAPLVATLHDLAFLHDPAHFTAHGIRLFRRCLAQLRRRADLVLCSSTATMDDCVASGLDADRLRLVLLGVAPPLDDARGDDPPGQAPPSAPTRPYVLFVGTVEPRKNLPRLVEAFHQARAEGALPPDAHLLLAGPAGWGDALPPGGAGPDVRLLGRVADAELAALYRGALVTAQPSVREGFGLPVLEAMAHGSPVVTSRGTSTEEVAGGAAVLVDPLDVGDIARGLADAVARRAELIVAGRVRAAELTWERTAAVTLAAYRELAP